MARVGVELETLVSEQDALTAQPPLLILENIHHYTFYGKL